MAATDSLAGRILVLEPQVVAKLRAGTLTRDDAGYQEWLRLQRERVQSADREDTDAASADCLG